MTRTAGDPVMVGKTAVYPTWKGDEIWIDQGRFACSIPITDAHAVADAIRLAATEAGVLDPTAALLVEALAAADRYIDKGHYEMARNITRAALAAAREWEARK